MRTLPVLLATLITLGSSHAAYQVQGGPCPTTALAESFGVGTPGENGVPRLTAPTAPNLGAPVALKIDNALPGSLAGLVYSFTEGDLFLPAFGSHLYPGFPNWFGFGFPVDSFGETPDLVLIPSIPPDWCGAPMVFQGFVFDPAAQGNYSTTPGLRMRFGTPPGGAPTIDPPVSPTAALQTTLTGTGSAGDNVLVQGGVSDVIAPVDIAGNWTAVVDLHTNAKNMLFVSAQFAGGGSSSPISVDVVQDGTPPAVFIDFPLDGDELTSTQVNVAGRVSDLLSGFAGLTVTVNGQAAIVDEGVGTNGTFELANLSLPVGETTVIEAIATDAVGNQATATISVEQLENDGGPTIEVVSGDDQLGQVYTELPAPIVVRVSDGTGLPVPNWPVELEVTANDGRLSPDGIVPGTISLELLTDASGEAQATWTLGGTAGCGNNRVRVSSPGVPGFADFCASATPAPPSQVNLGSGNFQVVPTGAQTPMALDVWISDGCNGIEGVPVEFRLDGGEGGLTGGGSVYAKSAIVLSDNTGHAEAVLAVGDTPRTYVVRATVPGVADQEIVFRTRAVEANDPTTSFTGIVFDSAGLPLIGAHCELEALGQTTLSTTTASDGTFSFPAIPYDGFAHLYVDGSTATMLGTQPAPSPIPADVRFPSLHFELLLLAQAENTLPNPIRLPRLFATNQVDYDGSEDVVLTLEGAEGLRIEIEAGSMTFPDGSHPTPQSPLAVPVKLSIDQVHADEIPMPMPDGASPPIPWTVQPGGATFDPPARVVYPNMAGLPAGAVANILTYDHATESFEIIATGSVSADGSVIESDPGAGLTLAGWGGICPPYPITGNVTNRRPILPGPLTSGAPFNFEAGESVVLRLTKTGPGTDFTVTVVTPLGPNNLQVMGKEELSVELPPFTYITSGVAPDTIPVFWPFVITWPDSEGGVDVEVVSTWSPDLQNDLKVGVDDRWKLRVKDAPADVDEAGGYVVENVSVDDSQPPFGVGDEYVRVRGELNSGGSVEYAFSNAPLFQIIESDTVIAPLLQTASQNEPDVVTLELSIPDAQLEVGETRQLVVLATKADDLNTQVPVPTSDDWTSYVTSDPAVITVDADGLATAEGPGIAYVSAYNNGAVAALKLVVVPINAKTIDIAVHVDDGTNPVSDAYVNLNGILGVEDSGTPGRYVLSDVPTFLDNGLMPVPPGPVVWVEAEVGLDSVPMTGVSPMLFLPDDGSPFVEPTITVRPVGSMDLVSELVIPEGDPQDVVENVQVDGFQAYVLSENTGFPRTIDVSYAPLPDFCPILPYNVEFTGPSTDLLYHEGFGGMLFTAQSTGGGNILSTGEQCSLSVLGGIGQPFLKGLDVWVDESGLDPVPYLYTSLGFADLSIFVGAVVRFDVSDVSGDIGQDYDVFLVQPGIGSAAGDLKITSDGAWCYWFNPGDPTFGVSNKLIAIDVTNPGAPFWTDIDLFGAGETYLEGDLVLSDDESVAYLSLMDHGLQMVGLDVPPQPVFNLLGRAPLQTTIGDVEGVAHIGKDRLAVWIRPLASSTSVVEILDISTPTAPFNVGTFPLTMLVREIYSSQGALYVVGNDPADGSVLRIYR